MVKNKKLFFTNTLEAVKNKDKYLNTLTSKGIKYKEYEIDKNVVQIIHE